MYGVSATVTASAWIKTSFVGSDTCNIDSFSISGGSDYATAIISCANPNLRITSEYTCANPSNGQVLANISANHWYKVDLKLVRGGTNAVLL